MRKLTHLLNFIIRLLLVVALLGGGLLIYSTCAGGKVIQRIDKTLPDPAVAPFQVATRTHIYYARSAAVNQDGSVTMSGWFARENGRWIKQGNDFTLKGEFQPRISRR